MTISIVSANEGQALEDFIGLPPRLYARFPEYIAPLKMDREGALRPDKAAFFKHGEAQYWLAYRDGEAVGRISAQLDHAQPPGAFDDAGLFGCVDAIDDAEVIAALFETAEAWLRDKGRTKAMGPFLLSINGEPGLLVKGRDEPPLILAPWHPAYLETHLLANGYVATQDLDYWRLEDLPRRAAALLEKPRAGARIKDLVVRPMDMKNLARDVEYLRQIYNDAWKDNWGFVPLEKSDMEALTNDFKPFVKPDYGFFVEKDGDTIAMAMLFPNLFEITRDIGANPSLLGWIKLGWRTMFHTFQTGHVVLLGVRSDYRHSVGGAVIAMTLVDAVVERLAKYATETGWLEAGWVLANNAPLKKILEQYGFEVKRTTRLYDKQLTAS